MHGLCSICSIGSPQFAGHIKGSTFYTSMCQKEHANSTQKCSGNVKEASGNVKKCKSNVKECKSNVKEHKNDVKEYKNDVKIDKVTMKRRR